MAPDTIAIVSAGIALLAAGGAWGAVVVNRRNATETIRAMVNTGARTSRAAVVSANRQKWIDAIRDDVAEFISVRWQLKRVQDLGRHLNMTSEHLPAEERLLKTKLVMLRARVEMRLNHEEDEHLGLLTAMDRYDQQASQLADIALRTQARSIFKAEWTRLKKEASGIDPFVREGVPERR